MVLFSCSSFGWAGLTLVRRVTGAGVFLFVCLFVGGLDSYSRGC